MTHSGAHPVQSVLVDGVAEPHLAVQRMFLVVAHKVDEALKLSRAAQHEETTFLLDTTVFDLSLRSTDRGTVKEQLPQKERFFVFSGFKDLTVDVVVMLLFGLPEGDGVGVVFTTFSHQESSISGDTHQHVFSLNTGQTGVVPPGKWPIVL